MWMIALFFALLGAMVKYGKMYFLIAGYNTLPREEKAKVDIEAIATLFRNVMFAIALIILLGSLLTYISGNTLIESLAFLAGLPAGIIYLLVKSNSAKYRIEKNKNRH